MSQITSSQIKMDTIQQDSKYRSTYPCWAIRPIEAVYTWISWNPRFHPFPWHPLCNNGIRKGPPFEFQSGICLIHSDTPRFSHVKIYNNQYICRDVIYHGPSGKKVIWDINFTSPKFRRWVEVIVSQAAACCCSNCWSMRSATSCSLQGCSKSAWFSQITWHAQNPWTTSVVVPQKAPKHITLGGGGWSYTFTFGCFLLFFGLTCSASTFPVV